MHELSRDVSNVVLFEFAVLFQHLEQLALRPEATVSGGWRRRDSRQAHLRELGDDAKLLLGLERVQQQDDVLVVESSQDLPSRTEA